MEYHEAREHTITTFDKDTIFAGELEYSTSLRICGKFYGSIETPGILFIDRTAEIEADIVAGTVVVNGIVRGNIVAKEKIEMLPNAKIYGNIEAARIKMNEGVILEGHCKHIK